MNAKINNIIDENQFVKEVDQRRLNLDRLRKKWDVCPIKRVMVSIARLELIKGLDILIDAWISTPIASNWLLLIAGEGSQYEELQKLIDSHGFRSSIRLVGYQSEDAIIDLLSLAEIFSLPSRGDPYPLAVIEAMFAGLPLLISNRIGCFPEALVPGQNGEFFDPVDSQSIGSALERLLSDTPESLKRKGNFSRQLAFDRFGTSKNIESLVAGLLSM